MPDKRNRQVESSGKASRFCDSSGVWPLTASRIFLPLLLRLLLLLCRCLLRLFQCLPELLHRSHPRRFQSVLCNVSPYGRATRPVCISSPQHFEDIFCYRPRFHPRTRPSARISRVRSIGRPPLLHANPYMAVRGLNRSGTRIHWTPTNRRIRNLSCSFSNPNHQVRRERLLH